MATYTLKGIGTAEVGRRDVKCNFSIASSEFFKRFATFQSSLSMDSQKAIGASILSKRAERVENSKEVDRFFSQISDQLKKEESGPKTVPKRVEEEKRGEKVPISVKETIQAKYEYNYLAAGTEKKELEEGYGIKTRDGQVIIKNIAKDQRIWDITGNFKHNGAIEKLDEKLHIKDLAANTEKKLTYKIKADKEPSIKVEEFISTVNNPSVKNITLIENKENEVYFKTSVENTEKYTIKNIKVSKQLFEGSTTPSIKYASAGNWKVEEKNLVWEIPELAANSRAAIECVLKVSIKSKDQKIRSGLMQITYEAASSLSELTVENFEAFGDNEVHTNDEQLDNNPDKYKGTLEFENLSPYLNVLKTVSVKVQGTDTELVKIDSKDPIQVSTKGKWQSNTWEIDTEGAIPAYEKNVAFILMSDLQATTANTIAIDDIELAVAFFEAKVEYDVTTIESYREVPFHAMHTLQNEGAVPFDYVSIKQRLPMHFKPPKADEIELSINEKEFKVKSDWVVVRDQELFLEMKDLRNEDIKAFAPGQTMNVTYPIVAQNLAATETFLSDNTWTVNTYPRGEPIIRTDKEKAIAIKVVHTRTKIFRGKSVLATAKLNEFDIVLKVINNGNFAIPVYELKDKIPANFKAQDFNIKPTEEDEICIWKLENVAINETREVRYKLVPSKDKATAKDAQFSM